MKETHRRGVGNRGKDPRSADGNKQRTAQHKIEERNKSSSCLLFSSRVGHSRGVGFGIHGKYSFFICPHFTDARRGNAWNVYLRSFPSVPHDWLGNMGHVSHFSSQRRGLPKSRLSKYIRELSRQF